MKNRLKNNLDLYNFFKDNYKFILIAVYSLSFINYYIYYKSFKVPIFNYLGISDLLFFTIEYIFKIIFSIFICEVVLYIIFGFCFMFYEKFVLFIVKRKARLYLNSNYKNQNRIKNIFERIFKKGLQRFRFTMVCILVFVIIYWGNSFFQGSLLYIIATFLIYMFYYFEKFSGMKNNKLTLEIFSFIIILFLTFNSIAELYNKRFIKDNYVFSFLENENFISTSKNHSCLNYLGETSSHIFLFNIENKETRIVSKSNISKLIIKNDSKLDTIIERTKESIILKHIKNGFR